MSTSYNHQWSSTEEHRRRPSKPGVLPHLRTLAEVEAATERATLDLRIYQATRHTYSPGQWADVRADFNDLFRDLAARRAELEALTS